MREYLGDDGITPYLFLIVEVGSGFIVQAGLKLMIFLTQPPECRDYRHAQLCLAFILYLVKIPTLIKKKKTEY
jgi:hypothetical protein